MSKVEQDVPIKTEKPDENSTIRVAETFSIKNEPLDGDEDEDEAVDPLDAEDDHVPDIDVSQFLQQNIVTPRNLEFDKRIFPQKSKKSYDPISDAIGSKERTFPNQNRNYNLALQKQKSSLTAKRARKVELERERRAELTLLYDRLQYWTEVDDAELATG